MRKLFRASTHLHQRFDRLRRRLLAVDSRLDAGAYSFFSTFARGWRHFRAVSDCFRVHGFKKWLNELACEALTWGTVAAVVMTALAKPAFETTRTDWQSRHELAVTFLDRHGNEIGKRGILQADLVTLDQLPDYFLKAAMAIEDRRFYQHFGIDILGTFRAIVANSRESQVVQGGSSFTQQLAKNLFLSNERTLERKIKEAFLALWLEARYSKDAIFKLYLERAYMGGGAFGVEAAAQFYFDKSARDLTLAESAMLAGLFKAPSKLAPHLNLPAARARANVVLDAMVAAGFMTSGQVHAARINPATPVIRAASTRPDFYLDWAFQEVKSLSLSGALGQARSLVVRTALDPATQKTSEESLEALVQQNGHSLRIQQGAVVVMDIYGGVRAMVGGKDYGASQFNRAVSALRQPGSSFKPFVYTAALLNGYTPNSIITDAPISIGNWTPQNYTRSYSGAVSLTTALAKSFNTVPVRLAQNIGRDKIIDVAKRMGIQTELKPIRSLPLGPTEVTVLDMAASYSVFANGGYRIPPHAALEVRNNTGKMLWQHNKNAADVARVLPPETVASINTMMVSVVTQGTGRRAQLEGIPVAGKTGTTQNYRDAWFVGYTGDFVGAVWLGNDDYSPTNRVSGGTYPTALWHDVMKVAHQDIAPSALFGFETLAQSSNIPRQRPSFKTAEPRGKNLNANTVTILLEMEAKMRQSGGVPLSGLYSTEPHLRIVHTQPYSRSHFSMQGKRETSSADLAAYSSVRSDSLGLAAAR